MKPFSRILVPIDFLPHSAEAVRRAMALADQCSAAVVLLHVHESGLYPIPPGEVIYGPEQLAQVTSTARARLEAVRREVDPTGQRRISVRVVQGTPASAIVDVATREPFELIVMGTHGRRGLGRFVLGSVAEEVTRLAPCAVLTVKSPQRATRAAPAAEPALWSRWGGAFFRPARATSPSVPPTLETNHVAPQRNLPPSL